MKGKNALVTASSKGIGFATAETLLAAGARVCISSSNESNLHHAREILQSKYPSDVFAAVCDLRNPSSVGELSKYVLSEMGSVDVLVNNCGGPPAGYFENIPDAAWNDAFHEILHSAAVLTRDCIPGMKQKGWGRIVNITSIAVYEYIDNLLLSTAFRSALTSFSKVLARQVAPHGITINNVAPGYTLTDRIHLLAERRAKDSGISKEEFLAEMQNRVPMKRFASPGEIAGCVQFFCTNAASYLTGNSLIVDGGLIQTVR